MKIRMAGLTALVASLVFAAGTGSEAGYTLTASEFNPVSQTFGGTTIGLTAIAPMGQYASTATDFSVIGVSANSTTVSPGSDSGSFQLEDTFTLTGTPGTETFTLSGTFFLKSGNTGGIVSTLNSSIIDIQGSGYTILFGGYSPPSQDSAAGGFDSGAISIAVFPLPSRLGGDAGPRVGRRRRPRFPSPIAGQAPRRLGPMMGDGPMPDGRLDRKGRRSGRIEAD